MEFVALTSKYEILERIYRTGSVRSAASSLSVSPSVVSHHLNSLEAHLGCKLFDRTPDGLKPTLLGERWAKLAIRNLEEVRELRSRIVGENLAKHTGLNLRIAAYPSLALHVLPPAVAAFLLQSASSTFEIKVHSSKDLLKGLIKNEFDAALLVDPPRRRGLLVRPLFESEFVVCVPKSCDSSWEAAELGIIVTKELEREIREQRTKSSEDSASQAPRLTVTHVVQDFEIARQLSLATKIPYASPSHLFHFIPELKETHEWKLHATLGRMGRHRVALCLHQEMKSDLALRSIGAWIRCNAPAL
jgi:DNA-binding transcriptional LysR family regulator